jgi:hypothetical protein
MVRVPGYTTQNKLSYVLEHQKFFDGLVCEFGVYKGRTLEILADYFDKVYGFDSFLGLPEAWNDKKKGDYYVGKAPIFPSNTIVYPGYFHETIPIFQNIPGDISFMHVDCDLYKSTKVIFDMLYDKIVPGTFILFDEFWNYPEWYNHEFKAFQEFVQLHNVSWTIETTTEQGTQVGVRIWSKQ